MRCSYCPQELIGERYAGPRLMPFDTFARALANTPDNLPISFAGYAELYLNRQCSAMIELAAIQQRRDVMVYTTGVGLDDSDAELLARVHPKILMLHLPDGDGNMKANVTPEYVGRIRRLSKSVASFRAVCYGAMHPMLEEFRPFLKNYGLHSRAGNVTKMTRMRIGGPLKCRVATDLDENVVLPDGRLALCCQDYGLTQIVGNLLTETWEEIHSGPAMRAFRELMRVGECLCRTCEFAVPA